MALVVSMRGLIFKFAKETTGGADWTDFYEFVKSSLDAVSNKSVARLRLLIGKLGVGRSDGGLEQGDAPVYWLTRMTLFFSSKSRFVGVTGISDSAKAMMATRSPALMRWAAPPLIMI